MRLGESGLSCLSVVASTAVRSRPLAAGLSVVGCCALVILGAQVRIPLPNTEVPMTLQALAVLLTGFALTPGRAVSAIFLYLACGAVGLPVFAAGSAGLAGSTGGYLVGFLVAAWLVSFLTGGDDVGFGRRLAVGAAGMVTILALGLAWRVMVFRGGLSLAAATGVTPFLIKAVVEVGLAATLAGTLRNRRRGRT